MSDLRAALAAALMLASCGSQSAEENNAQKPGVGVVTYVVPEKVGSPPKLPDRLSAFTDLDMARCHVIEENKEEGPYWRRACSAPPGWRVEWTESDLRQGLSLISSAGKETDLRLSDIVAKGAFNTLGKTIEWRGSNPAEPDALIVRMNVANGPEPGRLDISRLAVVRLIGTPCLVGVVEPGKGQNERARTIADGPKSECIKD